MLQTVTVATVLADVEQEEQAWREAAGQLHAQQEAYLSVLCATADHSDKPSDKTSNSQQTHAETFHAQRARNAHVDTLQAAVDREADTIQLVSKRVAAEQIKMQAHLDDIERHHAEECRMLRSQLESAEAAQVALTVKYNELKQRCKRQAAREADLRALLHGTANMALERAPVSSPHLTSSTGSSPAAGSKPCAEKENVANSKSTPAQSSCALRGGDLAPPCGECYTERANARLSRAFPTRPGTASPSSRQQWVDAVSYTTVDLSVEARKCSPPKDRSVPSPRRCAAWPAETPTAPGGVSEDVRAATARNTATHTASRARCGEARRGAATARKPAAQRRPWVPAGVSPPPSPRSTSPLEAVRGASHNGERSNKDQALPATRTRSLPSAPCPRAVSRPPAAPSTRASPMAPRGAQPARQPAQQRGWL
jgi:hypothetical protein